MDISPNIVDIAFLALAVFFAVKAALRGFIREFIGLLGLVAAVLLGAMFYLPLSDFLEHLSGIDSGWWQAVSFGLIMLVIFLICTYLAVGLSKVIQAGPFSFLDRLLGIGTGLAKALLLSYLLLNLLILFTPLHTPPALKDSLLAPYVLRGGRYIMDLVPNDLTRVMQERSGILKQSQPSKGNAKK